MEFRIKGQAGISIAFRADETGQITAVVVSQPQSTMTAQKKGR